MKHPHAEKMMLYAQDALESETPWERWEYKLKTDTGFRNLVKNPTWHKDVEYRRKQKTILIGCIEVPEPLRIAPNIGDIYYIVGIHRCSLYVDYEWRNDSDDLWYLKSGLVHSSPKAAIAHAKALISVSGGKILT